MRGFLVGSFVLVVAYVGLQKGTAGKVTAAGGTATNAFRRILSGDVAGIPNKASAPAKQPAPAPGPTNTADGIPEIYIPPYMPNAGTITTA